MPNYEDALRSATEKIQSDVQRRMLETLGLERRMFQPGSPLEDIRRSAELLQSRPPLPFRDLTILHPGDWPGIRAELQRAGIVVLDDPEDDHKFYIVDKGEKKRLWLVEAATPGKIMTFEPPREPLDY